MMRFPVGAIWALSLALWLPACTKSDPDPVCESRYHDACEDSERHLVQCDACGQAWSCQSVTEDGEEYLGWALTDWDCDCVEDDGTIVDSGLCVASE